MIQKSWLLAKRFAILLPGLIVAYFSVRTVFPFVDRKLHRLPDELSIIITYLIAVYVLIPAIIRLIRILWPPDHLPLYCVTPDGFASDPLNVGVIATRRELIEAFTKAGWYMPDPHTGVYLLKDIVCVALDRRYVTAPMSSLYMFGRRQDIAFEKPVGKSGAASRHHVRFWATTFQDEKRLSVRSIHWHHRDKHVQGDNLLWVGAASMDKGLALIRHNPQFTHMIHPDTNKERELIVKELSEQGLVQKTESVKLGDPYNLINRVWRGYLHTDGKMTIVRLRSNLSVRKPRTKRAK